MCSERSWNIGPEVRQTVNCVLCSPRGFSFNAASSPSDWLYFPPPPPPKKTLVFLTEPHLHCFRHPRLELWCRCFITPFQQIQKETADGCDTNVSTELSLFSARRWKVNILIHNNKNDETASGSFYDRGPLWWPSSDPEVMIHYLQLLLIHAILYIIPSSFSPHWD